MTHNEEWPAHWTAERALMFIRDYNFRDELPGPSGFADDFLSCIDRGYSIEDFKCWYPEWAKYADGSR